MTLLHEYHCPASLTEALRLITAPDRRLRPLAGGSTLVGDLETRAAQEIDGVVDLRNLDLDFVNPEDGHVHVGAMTTLTTLATHPLTRDLAGGLLARAARGEGPINLRNMATVGGIVAAAALDSEVYAALLALDAAVVCFTDAGEVVTRLAEVREIDGIITGVHIPVRAAHGGLARVARTPSDRPIVAVVAVHDDAGTRTALCGVAPRPVLDGAPLDPPHDFKGSADYRLALADILRARAITEARAA